MYIVSAHIWAPKGPNSYTNTFLKRIAPLINHSLYSLNEIECRIMDNELKWITCNYMEVVVLNLI